MRRSVRLMLTIWCWVMVIKEYCLYSRGLRRNDVESLVVRARCKLELWDSHHGLERGERADLVLDRQQEFRNLMVDNLAKVDEYKHMDEKISGYRCSCRE